MIDALIDRGHTSYREIGQRALTLTLERAGIPGAGTLHQPGLPVDPRVLHLRVCHLPI